MDFAVVFLAGVLWFGLATLQQIRARRERLQMRRHLQTIERPTSVSIAGAYCKNQA